MGRIRNPLYWRQYLGFESLSLRQLPRICALKSGINGDYFDQIKRIAAFALIYDGVPNWNKTDGIVRMTIPG